MSHLGLLPVSLVLLAASTIAVSYIVAVVRDDVRAAFPYISDTGSARPESCIFGQFLNFAAFLAFCTVYIRYKAVQALSPADNEDPRLIRLNKVSFFFGIISALGVSIVANFQEGTVVEAVHIVGAGLAFISGVLYCILQTALSYQMYPEYNGIFICRLRLAMSFTAILALLITTAAAGFALHEWNTKSHTDTKSKFKWAPGDPGYASHVVSAVGEWVTAFTFLFFFFTYAQEFNKFEMEVRTRALVRHLDDSPQTIQVLPPEVNERTKLLSSC